MSIKTILVNGNAQPLGHKGSYFRILSASADAPVFCSFQNAEGAQDDIELVAGLGLKKSQPFVSVTMTSTVEQTVKFYAGDDQVDDDRLAGNFDINAALSVAQTAAQAHAVPTLQNITVATEVLPARISRKNALIQVSGEVYVQSNNGVILSGLFAWENQSALTLIPVSGTVEVRINEDFD